MTRHLVKALQKVDDHDADFAPQENLRIIARGALDIFQDARYVGISREDQELVATVLESGLKDESCRWDQFLRDPGWLVRPRRNISLFAGARSLFACLVAQTSSRLLRRGIGSGRYLAG